jgi:pilus assembly protein CpaF
MSTDPLAKVRRDLRAQLRERVDARGLATAPRTERRLRVREEALTLMRESGALLPQRDLARVVNEVSDEVVGFGPIEFLLKDPDVTEVMVNGPDDVYVEREGPTTVRLRRPRSRWRSRASVVQPRSRRVSISLLVLRAIWPTWSRVFWIVADASMPRTLRGRPWLRSCRAAKPAISGRVGDHPGPRKIASPWGRTGPKKT